MYASLFVMFVIPIEPIAMLPIQDFILSNSTVGDTITIGCVIETCGTPNYVDFLNGQNISQRSFSRDDDGAFNWNPTVTKSLTGTYRCYAENSLGSASQTFNITGMCYVSSR